MQTGGDTYKVGERVFGAIDGVPGTIVSVDRGRGVVTVEWSGGKFPVDYPEDTIMIRRAYPWE